MANGNGTGSREAAKLLAVALISIISTWFAMGGPALSRMQSELQTSITAGEQREVRLRAVEIRGERMEAKIDLVLEKLK